MALNPKITDTGQKLRMTWTPDLTCQGYRFYVDGVAVSRTFKPDAAQTTFDKKPGTHEYGIQRMDVIDPLEEVQFPADPDPPTGYPESYYTGPLGDKNPLPEKGKAFLGVWGPGNDGGAVTWTQQKALIQSRQVDMGKPFDILLTVDTNPSDQAENRLPWINANGSIAACHLGAGMTLSGVVAGQHNAQIDALVARWGGYDFIVMVRLFHEFDQPTSYYGLGNPPLFVQAWRYIVNRFRNADNVGFWWCPGEGFAGNRTAGAQCYPGDDVVDWVGSDSYNWQRHGEGGYATPYHPGWATFKELFDYDDGHPGIPSVHRQFGPRKPFVVGETGCTFDNQPGQGPTKGPWYKEIPAAGATMEYMTGVCFFDIDASSESSGSSYPDRNDWRVPRLESIPSIYADWVTMAKDPYFDAR